MHLVTKEHFLYQFSREASPALTIHPGERVRLETRDCFSDQIHSQEKGMEEVNWEQINPATGPVYVEGAQPGDALKVTLEEIHFRDWAVMLTGKGLGELGHKLEGMHHRILPLRDNRLVFDDRLELPLNPMVGVLGVAPPGDPVNCGTPDTHGGNLDTTLLKEGAEVYLPVWAEGALLALGDLHAAMGDGEVCVSGAEVSGEVQIKVDLVKEMDLPTPLVTDQEVLAVIYSRKSLDEAVSGAVDIMEEIMRKGTGLATPDIAMLLSAAGRVRVSQVVDPLKTARCEVPRWILHQYGFNLR